MKLCIGNLGKWNSVKWNETRRIGAIFACFYVARVWQRQLGFLVIFHKRSTLRSSHLFVKQVQNQNRHCTNTTDSETVHFGRDLKIQQQNNQTTLKENMIFILMNVTWCITPAARRLHHTVARCPSQYFCPYNLQHHSQSYNLYFKLASTHTVLCATWLYPLTPTVAIRVQL